jgi:hypothetical protein
MAPISTRDLRGVPGVEKLRRVMESLAMLDAILCPDETVRTYRFDKGWGPGEALGSMNNGQGDTFFAVFSAVGCWLKGFAHEAALTPYRWTPPRVAEGMFEGLPEPFTAYLTEPAFEVEATTFCIWRPAGDGAWGCGTMALLAGKDPDGSAYLLRLLDGRAETVVAWAEENWIETGVWREGVEAVFAQQPLTEELVRGLNGEVGLEEVRGGAEAIGYPVG